MSLKIQDHYSIPEETARIARASFPKGNIYMKLRDELGQLYSDEFFANLFPSIGQAGQAPGFLALVTVMQFMEQLSDRQAAEAVRARIDWKYALGLELNDPGFDFSVLSEFRLRLILGSAEEQLLDRLLEIAKERGWLKARGSQRTDSTHVLASIRQVNRLELVGETMRASLNELARLAPDWLRDWMPAEWVERYGRRFDRIRLPKKEKEQKELAEIIGADGYQLLSRIYKKDTPMEARYAPMVEVLRQIWVQQYYQKDGQQSLRDTDNLPPNSILIQSPYDIQARYTTKRNMGWCGYKAHMTETCDEDRPNLIVHVATTPATTPDTDLPSSIHESLDAKDLLPGEHLMDMGYISTNLLVESQRRHQIEVIGPMKPDTTWQARMSQGFDVSCFQIDWEKKYVRCPQGKVSRDWFPAHKKPGYEIIHVRFSHQDCKSCQCRNLCTKAKEGPRSLKLRPKIEHLTLEQARINQDSEEFKKRYAKRAGIEGSISQGTRCCGLRRSRYIGLAKTHLQLVLSVVSINLNRLTDWLDEKPRAQTRPSPLLALAMN